MIYRTTRCPYCRSELEHMSPFVKELIGPPVAKCPACELPIRTGMSYWPQMSMGAKLWFFTRALLLMPWTIALLTAMTMIVPALLLPFVIDDVEGFHERNSHAIPWIAAMIATAWSVVYVRRIVVLVRMRADDEDSVPEWR